jgi:hypothetical protein
MDADSFNPCVRAIHEVRATRVVRVVRAIRVRPRQKGIAQAAAAALLALHAGTALACDPALRGDGVVRVEGQRFVVAFRPQPAPIRLSEFFALDVAVCARDGTAPAALRVDARMPEHNHGMNYRPRVFARGNGRFEATGLLLHMQGRWQLSFDAQSPGSAETLRTDVRLD